MNENHLQNQGYNSVAGLTQFLEDVEVHSVLFPCLAEYNQCSTTIY